MSDTITVPVRPEEEIEVPLPAAVPEIAPLDRTLETIRTDSLRQPEKYLEETETPDGGE